MMKYAFELAKQSGADIPVGAVIVRNGQIISSACNKKELTNDVTAHAEILALREAAQKLKNWRLEGCEMYVTLEPCPMCAGAIANARIKKLIFGCQEKTSSENLCEQILKSNRLNHHTEMVFDQAYENEISAMLTNFFQTKRKR